MKSFLFHIFVFFILCGCSSTGEPRSRSSNEDSDLDFRGNDCILIRTIRDYRPLDKQHLLVYGSGNRAYFVSLFRPTFGGLESFGLRVISRDDQLCPGGDSLVFGSFGDERVAVKAISRVTAEQEEYLLTRYGVEQPARQQAPADPEKVKGADVEELGQVGPGFQKK